MNLNSENITFIIVSYRSEKIIEECLKTLPKTSNKIIIENSQNIELKKHLETKYDNIEVIISENIGMGAANNLGLKRCKTQFGYVINPDVRFNNNTIDVIIDSLKLVNDFAILSPFNGNEKNPNYLIKKNYKNINQNILSVDHVDGFSLLINKEKFKDDVYFDENFFLYLENDDLCLRTKKNNENIYLIKNSLINHLGASSSNQSSTKELEYSRNWHWMWSKFYYNKKHYGFAIGLLNISSNIFSGLMKFIFYSIIFNKYKKKIYKMRLLGIINSIIGKSSWYRPDIKD